MTEKQFYDWQTAGGVDDVTRVFEAISGAGVDWCVIGGVAVNHWAEHPMVTQDVDLAVAGEFVDDIAAMLERDGFRVRRFQWSLNVQGGSAVSIQFSFAELYRDFPTRALDAEIHGMRMRVASLDDTLLGKIAAWTDIARRQSKRFKDLADIARLVESHPRLWGTLPDTLKGQIERPAE